jgi:hypothetical protein
MFRYRIYGLVLQSDVEFSHLVKAGDDENVDVRIRYGNIRDEVIECLKHAQVKTYDIGFEKSCFMNKGGYYRISDGKEIIYETKDGYTPEGVGPWLLGFAFAMLLMQRNSLAVHCSAIADKDGAFLISGVPGAGKSSLTRVLLERGYGIMADDVAAVNVEEDGVNVYPAFPYQKLCRNEVEKREMDEDDLIYINEDKDKYLVPVGDAFIGEKRPLKYLIFIVVSNKDRVEVHKLSGLNQLFAIKENLFLTRLKGSWLNQKQLLDACLKVASSCPVYLIERPNGVDTLLEMADTVEKIAREID